MNIIYKQINFSESNVYTGNKYPSIDGNRPHASCTHTTSFSAALYSLVSRLDHNILQLQ